MTTKPGTRPWVPMGSFTGRDAKMMAEQTAVSLSGIGSNGKPMIFEACQVRSGKKSRWAVRRVM